ncbi:hypothetical protein [Acaryochloris sp. IP29b_bin.148]|uniref:hypothetical protein n=1 Tax=Acaryochloris sp. IP29b_bin.148 TaxID=2969218 RepID=UPI0026154E77|nr:hypothetical protein [Acaryochloris sp. IP29b_bin.148]
MKRTIYLPDDLNERISDYLQQNPQASFSSLVQDALETKLASKDLSHVLKLAGMVKDAQGPAVAQHAEDNVALENHQ